MASILIVSCVGYNLPQNSLSMPGPANLFNDTCISTTRTLRLASIANMNCACGNLMQLISLINLVKSSLINPLTTSTNGDDLSNSRLLPSQSPQMTATSSFCGWR